MSDLTPTQSSKIMMVITSIVFFVEGIFMFTDNRWAIIPRINNQVYFIIAGIIGLVISIIIFLSLKLFKLPLPEKFNLDMSIFNLIVITLIAWAFSLAYGLLCSLISLLISNFQRVKKQS